MSLPRTVRYRNCIAMGSGNIRSPVFLKSLHYFCFFFHIFTICYSYPHKKVGLIMKQICSILLVCLLLTGCSGKIPAETTPEIKPEKTTTESPEIKTEIPYCSRFDTVTEIALSDDGMLMPDSDFISITNDIIYYEDRAVYDSGNPYGEGTAEEQHSAEEAAAHTVVTITKPGAYRVTGTLSAGQIRIDLGEDAKKDPAAVVELILDNADITCTVAPAILFQNVYECDEDASADTASPEVDTAAAGANLILEGSSKVNGSHVAKIFRDSDGEKKLWKQDGAIYSYMSMNVFGPGNLELTADNEGLDTEMHLTLNGGNIHIYSGNDGINTNEDGVSVTTINGGNLTIFAGLGEEGDGIDSNGYLVINGGNVISAANPKADAGLDSDLGSFIHGGTVIAMGSAMDWAESDSNQVTMNLQFLQQQEAGSKITIRDPGSSEYITFETEGDHARPFSGLILSHPGFVQGSTYHVYVDDARMAYTGTDVGHGPGGMDPRPEMPEGWEPGQRMELPEGETMPEGFDPGKMGGRGQKPGNWEDRTPPEGFDGEIPTRPEGEIPKMPEGGFRGEGSRDLPNGRPSTDFYMNDKVNAFSGVMPTADATA